VRIEGQSEIALRSRYKNKSGKCAGEIVLAHERRHGAVAKTEYDNLAAVIKKQIRKLFAGFRVFYSPAPSFPGSSTSIGTPGSDLAARMERADLMWLMLAVAVNLEVRNSW